MRIRNAASSLVAVVCLAAACGGLPDEPVPPPPMTHVGEAVPLPDDPARQFDFWVGDWAVVNKHLRRSGRWIDGGRAVARIRSVVDGGAILERWNGEARGDRLIGFSLRAWDPELGKWVIYLNWHGGRPAGFFVMHGERDGQRVELFPPGDETRIRYSFSQAHEGSAQWDSAVSKDGGETWITEWVMQFTRTAKPQSIDASSAALELPPLEAEKFEETRRLDALLGAWRGSARRRLDDGTWESGTVEARVTSMIEGFGLLQFLDTSWGDQSLAALGFDTGIERWSGVRAASDRAGLLGLAVDVEEGSVRLLAESNGGDLRETWERVTEASYRWTRALRQGGDWITVLEADLERRREG